MSYSVKKAGVGFRVKIDTGSDLSGQAAGFSAYYIKDADGTRTDVIGSFAEDANTAGLYLSPEIIIPDTGDYTLVANNAAAGMDNHPTPIVVTQASIDDIKVVVDSLATTLATVAADVDGLDGQNLSDIKTSLADINTLLDDQDGTTVNSVMEFVEEINGALTSGATGLAALKGYTDDVEALLLGTEFLSDGVTDNPLYGANNADLKALIGTNLVTLQGNLASAQTAVVSAIDAAKVLIQADIAAVNALTTANKGLLEDPANGLAEIKAAVDAVASSIAGGGGTSLGDLINDLDGDVVILQAAMNSRFDTVDANLANIEAKVDTIGGAQGFRAFV